MLLRDEWVGFTSLVFYGFPKKATFHLYMTGPGMVFRLVTVFNTLWSYILIYCLKKKKKKVKNEVKKRSDGPCF